MTWLPSEPLHDIIIPNTFAELLAERLTPSHPYVEIIQSRSGPRPMIKESRVGADMIVGYARAGYAPTEIATDILSHLTLAQVYDALSYYKDHRAIIDQALQTNTSEAWRKRLRQRMGVTAADQLLGGCAAVVFPATATEKRGFCCLGHREFGYWHDGEA